MGIFEVMHVDTKLRELILAKATSETIQEQAVKNGMTTMIEDGLDKVRKGVTTLEELLRVIRS
jgi:type II secretory ATPase GspE/PulE/Tfp pilus assembly ATPase PilB-like protein